jgi:Domain of unknown function (DUF4145)
MKCPHCNTSIAAAFAEAQFADYPQAVPDSNKAASHRTLWTVSHMRCPECYEAIIYLKRSFPNNAVAVPVTLVYPNRKVRPVPAEVVDPYRQDFIEACKVLEDSPKASAALSRRCLQAILRDKASTKKKDLYDQIEEVIASGKLPSHICEDLHSIRVVGNFGAHPMKSTATGEIIDVETGEAEWNLDVLELLFDFYFVQPAISAKRKADLNLKLKAAGKPELP